MCAPTLLVCGSACGSLQHFLLQRLAWMPRWTRQDCVTNIDVNRKQSRVTVTGYVDRSKVLNKVMSTGKKAEFWPYVPYNLVSYPYVAQAYDKKAPSGYVRNVVQAVPGPNDADEKYTSLFSDENVNACSIM